MKLLAIKTKIEYILTKYKRLNYLNKILSKFFFFNLKYSNYLRIFYEYNKRNEKIFSYPSEIYLTTTNICNYRCKFCEIHYFYEFAKNKAGVVFNNNLNLKLINKFEDIFDRVGYIELSGASGEPFMNQDFIKICKKLKQKNIDLSVTTNGSLIRESIAKELVMMKFNTIILSLHSGEAENYRELLGGNYNQVLNNLKSIVKIKKKLNSDLPYITVNCLIFKLNQHTLKDLISQLKQIGIDSMNINQYYASRNKIEGRVSFYFFPEEGDQFLKELYEYAKSINFKLTPESPSFVNPQINKFDRNQIKLCESPWRSLKFKGCVQHKDSLYIGICNRILLFRLNYEEFEGDFLKDIWNHELIRYIRRTVTKNPICQFCQNPGTPRLRCINNRSYQIERDKAVRNFFKDALNSIEIKQRKGIYIFEKNPYEYIDYYEKHSYIEYK